MVRAIAPSVETDLVRDEFARIAEIRSVYAFFRNNVCHVTVALDHKDYALEDRIYDSEYSLMERTGLRFEVNIVVLAGRKLQDVLTPLGELLIQRAA